MEDHVRWEISNSNLTLQIKNRKIIYISAFSGALTFGEVEGGAYTEKSASIPVYQFDDFVDEVGKVIDFFESKELGKNLSLQSLIGNHHWEGKTNTENSTLSKKTVLFCKSKVEVLTLTDIELVHFLTTITHIILFTFLFHDQHLFFVEQLIHDKDCFTISQTLDTENLKEFTKKFSVKNKCGNFALKQIAMHFKNEIEMIYCLLIRVNDLMTSDVGF